MTTAIAEPEREMVRRLAPWGVPAALAACLLGWVVGGRDVGVSAFLGIVVVTANFVANGLSLAWAARVSLTALSAVAMGGFVVRLGVIVAIMAGLDRFAFFSPLAFGLAVVPATLLLLGFEMRLVARGVGRELQIPPPPAAMKGRVPR